MRQMNNVVYEFNNPEVKINKRQVAKLIGINHETLGRIMNGKIKCKYPIAYMLTLILEGKHIETDINKYFKK